MITKEQGVLWDNDPYALPKTKESAAIVMQMLYEHLRDSGVGPDSEEAKRASQSFGTSYPEWLTAST